MNFARVNLFEARAVQDAARNAWLGARSPDEPEKVLKGVRWLLLEDDIPPWLTNRTGTPAIRVYR